MKTIEVEKTGGPDVLHIQDIGGLEPPGPGQALVRIVYAGVNFVDVGQRRGTYPREVPFTPGGPGQFNIALNVDGVQAGSRKVGVVGAVGAADNRVDVVDPLSVDPRSPRSRTSGRSRRR